MKQPELGKKIGEIRNQKGITQKELSDSCNIDIRTIQRIEGGEVSPRMSTLRLIAETLECETSLFNGEPETVDPPSPWLKPILLVSIIAGICHILNWVFYVPAIPGVPVITSEVGRSILTLIYMLAGSLFFFGFFRLALFKKSRILQFGAMAVVVLIPLSGLAELASIHTGSEAAILIKKMLDILMTLNGITVGVGLLTTVSRYRVWYIITGVLQILITPLFLIPVGVIQIVGFWLSCPFLGLMALILILEYYALRD
jgi:transcriptional regulator with XRE-family HTH domain